MSDIHFLLTSGMMGNLLLLSDIYEHPATSLVGESPLSTAPEASALVAAALASAESLLCLLDEMLDMQNMQQKRLKVWYFEEGGVIL